MTKSSVGMRVVIYVFLLGLFLGALTLTGGALYQYRAQQEDEKLAPGKFYSVGDDRFHLYCMGEGSPVVFLEAGHLQDYAIWRDVQTGTSEFTKVCSYDRLGLGWSSAASQPTTSDYVASNLNRLINTATNDEPIVLVGFSAGGIYIRKYFELFPERVAGMVFVDSSHEQQDLQNSKNDREWPTHDYFPMWGPCSLLAWTGYFRVTHYFDSKWMNSLPEQRHRELVAQANRTGHCAGILYGNAFEQDVTSSEPPKPLGDLPVAAIRRAKNHTEGYSENLLNYVHNIRPQLQQELAQLSSETEAYIAEESAHGVPYEQPEIVINAIKSLVDRIEEKESLAN